MEESSMSQLYQFDRLCPKCGKEYGDHRYRGENADLACPERHPMPVESRDDLVKDLEHAASVADLDGLTQWEPIFRSAAKRIAELEAERDRIARNRDMWKGQSERQAVALAEERERCARIADDHTPRKHEGTLAAHVVGRTIATAIRSGKPDGKE